MTILAFDTSMAACSVAILHDGVASPIQCFERMERGHAEALFPMIEAVMAKAGCGFGDLTKLAVTVGPGSFTGVRAGVAAARGFALAAKLPVVAVTSLEVMARGLVRQSSTERGSGFMVAHDARREEFYVQSFTAEGEPLSEPELCGLSEAADALLPGIGLVVGSGAVAIALEAAHHGGELHAGFADLLPEAGDLAAIAVNRCPQHRQVAPLYLRAPDAKPQTDKSLARAG